MSPRESMRVGAAATRTAALAALLALTACAGIVRVSPPDDEVRREVMQVLEAQAAAWNRGDLEGFMDGYWRSEELVFTSGGRVQRGWQTTLERYRATYGTAPATMGLLSFHDVEVHPVDGSAWVLGHWSLDRGGREQGGVFTLVFREIGGRWLIVHDHTSLSAGN